jgi:hypothetical protein
MARSDRPTAPSASTRRPSSPHCDGLPRTRPLARTFGFDTHHVASASTRSGPHPSPSRALIGPDVEAQSRSVRGCLASPSTFRSMPIQHRPERPVLLAVDRQLAVRRGRFT